MVRIPFISRWFTKADPAAAAALFKTRYAHFKALLDSNAELLSLVTDMEEKLRGDTAFGMAYVRSQASRSVFHASRMVQSFDALSGGRYPELAAILDSIRSKIGEFTAGRERRDDCPIILLHRDICRDQIDCVGGKNANLGEMRSRAGMPIPEGFAITTAGYAAFVRHGGFQDEIRKIEMEVETDDPDSIVAASEGIQHLFLAADPPPELSGAILAAYEDLCARRGRRVPIALRSSAIGEDSELSFAGQYLTVLNVPPGRIIDNYKRVLASLFTPRAMAYRLNKGIPSEDTAMSVVCLEMVQSRASGVMYSRHPYDLLDENVLVNAVWGLGPYAVDGVVEPDCLRLSKEEPPRLLSAKVAPKTVRLAGRGDGGTVEEAVDPELRDTPCLEPAQAEALAAMAVALERHFQCPQDIEWAIDAEGRILLLQARPLRVEAAADGKPAGTTPLIPGFDLLLQGGEVACPGIGCGPVRHVSPETDLAAVPPDSVLVAEHSSPKFALILPRSQAVVTNAGSVTGHMASLTREFSVPALLNTHSATAALAEGEIVTVDAYSARVYRGRVPELVKLRRERGNFMMDTPVYQTLRRLAELVIPLHLVDPKSPDFIPGNCRSLHDLMRYMHELSYTEMFQISDLTTNKGSFSLHLQARLPLDLYLVDLGGGLSTHHSVKRYVKPDEVVSRPFKALLDGMLSEDLRHMEPRPVDLKGFFSVMGQQMMSNPTAGGERFGDRSYAIISDKYMNFSSRVGYHYGVIDSYCGKNVNKNYINFQFKGGAADETRRNRRVRSIALILSGNYHYDPTHGPE